MNILLLTKMMVFSATVMISSLFTTSVSTDENVAEHCVIEETYEVEEKGDIVDCEEHTEDTCSPNSPVFCVDPEEEIWWR